MPSIRAFAIGAASVASILHATSCTPSTVQEDAGVRDPDAPSDVAAPDAHVERACTAPEEPSRLVVTADWLARSLTLLGLERVLDPGCDAREAIVGTIDLARYAPGPLEVEISPDGRSAVVAIGPGFFEGVGSALVGMPDVPPGGRLLVVDLERRAVRAEIPVTHVPMGIAISPDGTRAYVAEYGTNAEPGTEIAIVDLATDTLIDEVSIGPRPEQIVLSADGALGAATVDDGTVVFRTSDLRGSLAPTLVTGRDPSGTHALVPHPIERVLVSVDLATGEEHALQWLDATGPTYVAIQPTP